MWVKKHGQVKKMREKLHLKNIYLNIIQAQLKFRNAYIKIRVY